MVPINKVIKLAKQSKADLLIFADDGRKVFGHKLVFGMFSEILADLFTDMKTEENLTTLIVPVGFKQLSDLTKMLENILDLTERDCEAVTEVSKVLGIDLLDAAVNIKVTTYPATKFSVENTDVILKQEEDVGDVPNPVSLTEVNENVTKRGRPKSKKRKPDPNHIYSCTECNARFKKKSILKKHKLKKHNIKIKCEVCHDNFIDFKTYQQHRKIHLSYVCEQCGVVFKSATQLSTHERNEHGKGDNNKSCPFCDKRVLNLKTHIKASHEAEKMLCPKCSYATRRKADMEKHIEHMHTETEMKTCQFCGGSFKRVEAHLKISKCGQETESVRHPCSQYDQTFNLQIRGRQCAYCDYKTHTKFNLDLHVNKMHLGIKTEKQACNYCQKSTFNLDYHMKIYHGELLK